MIDSVLALLGSGLGGAMRLIPELLKGKAETKNREHDYRMAELQLKIAQEHGVAGLATIQAQALSQAIQGQSQITGVRWVDAVSSTVRPFVTYWWMLLFTIYKVCAILVAWQATTSLADFADQIWTENDWAILSTILGFWFVDRAIIRSR